MKAEEDEQLLQLISDALRDGPGSAAWEEAVHIIDATDGRELDALYRVRQRLESGKRWRQVRPGTTFTRKVMDAVDQQSDAAVRPAGPATIIAILCGLLVLVVIAALVPMLLSHGKATVSHEDELNGVLFSVPWVQSDFDHEITGEWKLIGTLPVQANHGLTAKSSGDGDWGIESVRTLGPHQFFSYEAKLRAPRDGTVTQIYVADSIGTYIAVIVDADFVRVMEPSMDNMDKVSGRPRDFPSAFGAGDHEVAEFQRGPGPEIDIRWLIGWKAAALEINGKRVWAGDNNLSSNQPREIGIGFLVHDNLGHDAKIESINVRTKN